MNEDLERVARVIAGVMVDEGDFSIERHLAIKAARAAIESIREPSKAMLEAAMSQPGEQGYDDIWRVMIDTILAPAPINPLDHEQTK